MSRSLVAVVALIVVLGAALVFGMQRGRLAGAMQDGTYVGESDRDDRNQYGRIELEISNGRITAADYTEFDSDGNPKGEEYPYPLAVEAQSTFEERLVETQDPEQVDNVTGATTTWNKFKAATRNALDKAREQ